MFCTPRDLVWPSNVFKPDNPIQLPQAEVGPVPTYAECLNLRLKPREDAGNKKKKGGKNKGGGADDDEDLDAILASMGVTNAKPEAKKAAEKSREFSFFTSAGSWNIYY